MGSSFKYIIPQKLKGENIDSKTFVPQISRQVASFQTGISSPSQVPFTIADERKIPGLGGKARQSLGEALVAIASAQGPRRPRPKQNIMIRALSRFAMWS